MPSSWNDVTVTRENVDANTVCYTYSSPTIFNDPDNPATITVRDVAPALAALEGFPQSVQEALDQGYEPLGFTEISLTSAAGSGAPGSRSPSSDTVCTLDGDEPDDSENLDGTQYYYKTSDAADGGSCASILGFTVWAECKSVCLLYTADAADD